VQRGLSRSQRERESNVDGVFPISMLCFSLSFLLDDFPLNPASLLQGLYFLHACTVLPTGACRILVHFGTLNCLVPIEAYSSARSSQDGLHTLLKVLSLDRASNIQTFRTRLLCGASIVSPLCKKETGFSY
jgi:hypothetical protein